KSPETRPREGLSWRTPSNRLLARDSAGRRGLAGDGEEDLLERHRGSLRVHNSWRLAEAFEGEVVVVRDDRVHSPSAHMDPHGVEGVELRSPGLPLRPDVVPVADAPEPAPERLDVLV